jgi:hypothetical protein
MSTYLSRLASQATNLVIQNIDKISFELKPQLHSPMRRQQATPRAASMSYISHHARNTPSTELTHPGCYR